MWKEGKENGNRAEGEEGETNRDAETVVTGEVATDRRPADVLFDNSAFKNVPQRVRVFSRRYYQVVQKRLC